MHENGTMKSVETILRNRRGGIKEKDGGVESKIYYKHLCKCHSVSQYKYNMLINFKM
jgi:hypothetical protein